jgi:hypothetical protein
MILNYSFYWQLFKLLNFVFYFLVFLLLEVTQLEGFLIHFIVKLIKKLVMLVFIMKRMKMK